MYIKFIKRLIDLFISVLTIIFIFPLLILVAIILKFTGEGEIFYFQERVKKNMNIFKIIKFATMLKNSPNIGDKLYTAENDERVLRVGKILRKTKINELPQIFNIIKGDMSVVGPRPLALETFMLYSEPGIRKISSIKPGLTGLSSIFFANEDKFMKNASNKEEFYKTEISPVKEKLELYYIEHLSILIDIKIIVCTFLKIIGISNKLLIIFFPDIKKILKDKELF